MGQAYPDISRILSAKAQRRLALAALSWEEKVAIIEQMQVLLPKGLWKPEPTNEKFQDQKRAAQHRLPPDSGDVSAKQP